MENRGGIELWKTGLILWMSVALLSCEEKPVETPVHDTWKVYRGGAGAQQFSDLDQINKENVHLLEPAWIFHTGEKTERSPMECNPIVIGNTMYITSANLDLIALDAGTGETKWRYVVDVKDRASGVNRGVTYFEDSSGGRIFFSVGYYLYAVHAGTGDLVSGFGKEGRIDMRQNLDRDSEDISVTLSSPVIVFEDLIIMGSATGEGYDASPGHIRSYNAYSGELVWIFHTIPQDGQFGYDTWKWVEGENYGGTNNWGGLSLDLDKGWVFAATGSPAYDFYGANRKGANLYGNSIIALDARTGERQWHYQTVKHDIWDYDLPAAPTLIDLPGDGGVIKALVQPTKMGELILLDRYTGRPIVNPEEIPVPRSTVPGEEAFPSQLQNQGITIVTQGFDTAKITNISSDAALFIKEELKKYKNEGMYTPPSLEGTIAMPGTRGGVLWGGLSYDHHKNMVYVNANEIPMILKLKKIEQEGLKGESLGYNLYMSNCSSCHGSNKEGLTDTYPSLQDVGNQLSDSAMVAIIQKGKGLMPAFAQLDPEQMDALVAYLKDDVLQKKRNSEAIPQQMDRYVLDGFKIFTDQEGFPANQPPWGTLNAVDLSTMSVKWRVPLGYYPELKQRGLPDTGTQNFGGCVATAGGLVFIGGSADEMFRAFDADTGEILWEYKLSAGGYAVPAVYQIDGRQYIVIAAGGGNRIGTPTGDAFYAFALPEKEVQKF